MTSTPTIHLALVGDHLPKAVSHIAIPLAIARAASKLNIKVVHTWNHSTALGGPNLDALQSADAIWIVPGSPYADDDAIFAAIRWARENNKPFLGSCGGFQYAVLEYARNVLGWEDAGHEETDGSTDGAGQGRRMVISRLACSLVEKRGKVTFAPESRIAKAYGSLESEEGYHCNFGVDGKFKDALEGKNLRVTSWDEDGDVRGVELIDHTFYVATLFQSERAALQEKDSPLVIALLEAALGNKK